MSYTPYLIANYATGIDVRLQPWLSPDDAQEELFDGFVFRGIMSKRPGYKYYATGEVGNAPYVESRVVNTLTNDRLTNSSQVQILGNGTMGPYAFQTFNADLRRGSISITASPSGAAQTVTDAGGTGVLSGQGTGSINYTTGVGTVTFTNNVVGGDPIVLTYSYYPDEPVMGVMNYVAVDNTKKMIIGTTKRLNIYNATTNQLDYLGSDLTITGITIGAPGVITTSAAVNLSVGDTVYFYGIRGTVQLNNTEHVVIAVAGNTFSIVSTTGYTAYVAGGFAQHVYTGTKLNFWSWLNYKDKNGNPRLIFTNNKDQVQYYQPANAPDPLVGNYVNYPNAATPDFLMYQDGGTTPVTVLTALQAFEYKDRLQFQRTTEEGVIKPQRLRISGTGVNSDNFTLTAIAPSTVAGIGAGTIDIPDGNWISGSASNRDDLVLMTEGSTWIEQYTGNDTVPIAIKRIDESRGSHAPFGVITYLNRTTAPSKRGLIISDGYRVERADEVIPDFSFDSIDPSAFALCFVGIVDEDRDHYLLYPTPGQTDAVSNRILTTNYEEDNYAIYRLPLSCMGVFEVSKNITWNDLLKYNNWTELADAYNTWNDFSFAKAAPIAIGGGHHGEVWQMNVNESEDNPVKIRAITNPGGGILQVTTDWNNYQDGTSNESDLEADFIFFSGILGMVELNNKQYPIKQIIDKYTFTIEVPSQTTFSTYMANTGTAIRVIPFTALFKKFNPYVEMDKKVRCGWIYFYISVSGTNLTRSIELAGITNANPAVVTTVMQHGLTTGNQVSFFGVGGMTEINNVAAYITVLTPTSFSLTSVDSTAFGVYTPGGYAAVAENAVLQVEITTDDRNNPVRIENLSPIPLRANCSNLVLQDDGKKWYKMYVNQVGKFIQFRISNQQAGAVINVHATMLGFQPLGRLI